MGESIRIYLLAFKKKKLVDGRDMNMGANPVRVRPIFEEFIGTFGGGLRGACKDVPDSCIGGLQEVGSVGTGRDDGLSRREHETVLIVDIAVGIVECRNTVKGNGRPRRKDSG